MTTPTLTCPVIEDNFWPTPTDVHVHDNVRKASEAARGLKEKGCAVYDHHDIAPVVELWKDGEPILVLFPRNISRDNALASARIAAGPVQPDMIVATLDAHVTQSMNNPATGKPWAPGEMQASCDDDGACATGLLTDCLATMAVFKDGHHEMLQRRYRGHETAGNLVWLGTGEEMVSSADSPAVSGYVQEHLMGSLKFAWDETSQLAKAEHDLAMMATEEGIDEKMQFWHRVCAGAKLALLSGAAGGALICAPDDEVKALAADSLSEERLAADSEGPLGVLAMLLAMKLGVE